MPTRSISEFAATSEGADFYRAYDRVLGKWPLDVTCLDVTSTYGTTRVNVCGPVGAPPLVVLPGAGATSTVWFANVAALADRYRVHAVDLIGDVGRSVADGQPLRTVDDLMSWLDAVAASSGLNTFGLVGHSYGAMIALAYSIRAPERVTKLALLEPNSCFAGMRAGYLVRAVPILLRPTEKRERRFVRWETGGHPLDDDWLDLLALGAAHFPKARTVVPKRPEPGALTTDTTVILATESKVHRSRRIATALATSMPHLHVTVLEGATHHMLPMAPAEAVNDALSAALDATRGSANHLS